jgi:hypothetical protein
MTGKKCNTCDKQIKGRGHIGMAEHDGEFFCVRCVKELVEQHESLDEQIKERQEEVEELEEEIELLEQERIDCLIELAA